MWVILSWIALSAYGTLAFVATLNALLIPRLRRAAGSTTIAVLIPARNEAANLSQLLPALAAGTEVFVYDDGSSDGTADGAAALGATVIRGSEDLPPGWTGKSHACRELAKVASEASPAARWLYLDADTRPHADLLAALDAWVQREGHRFPVLTGFPRVLPGRGAEPLMMAWVWWILLSTNPFGLVARTRLGHNRFTNGQVVLWDARRYWEVDPHQEVRCAILEDVAIGRLLARRGLPVKIVAFGELLSVRMYETSRQAWDGMSKNAYEITGTLAGTLALALLLAALGLGWMALGENRWIGLGFLVWSQLMTIVIVRSPMWTLLTTPANLLMGAVTLVRSALWHRRKRVTWKSREYRGD